MHDGLRAACEYVILRSAMQLACTLGDAATCVVTAEHLRAGLRHELAAPRGTCALLAPLAELLDELELRDMVDAGVQTELGRLVTSSGGAFANLLQSSAFFHGLMAAVGTNHPGAPRLLPSALELVLANVDPAAHVSHETLAQLQHDDRDDHDDATPSLPVADLARLQAYVSTNLPTEADVAQRGSAPTSCLELIALHLLETVTPFADAACDGASAQTQRTTRRT